MDCVLIKDTTGIPLNIISVLKKTDMWVTVMKYLKTVGSPLLKQKTLNLKL